MIKIKIGSIDMYGLNGRNLHPMKSDEGKTGELVEARREIFSDCDCGIATGSFDRNCPGCAGSGFYPVIFMLVDLPDGRTIELAEYEVEEMKVSEE
jgi:hypothetical protein